MSWASNHELLTTGKMREKRRPPTDFEIWTDPAHTRAWFG